MSTRDVRRTIAHSPDADNAPNGKNFSMQLPEPAGATVVKVIVSVKKDLFEVADPTTFLTDGVRNADGKNAAASITINYVEVEPDRWSNSWCSDGVFYSESQ